MTSFTFYKQRILKSIISITLLIDCLDFFFHLLTCRIKLFTSDVIEESTAIMKMLKDKKSDKETRKHIWKCTSRVLFIQYAHCETAVCLMYSQVLAWYQLFQSVLCSKLQALVRKQICEQEGSLAVKCRRQKRKHIKLPCYLFSLC